MSEGMAGMVHANDVRIAEGLRDIELPDDAGAAMATWNRTLNDAVTQWHRERGRATSPTSTSSTAQGLNLEFLGHCFPHSFVLPMYSSASAYRFRPLGPEETLMEIWSLTRYPEGEEREPPTPPEVVGATTTRAGRRSPPRTSRTSPGSNGACTRRGSSTCACRSELEGHVSNFERTIDGFLAGLPHEQLLPALPRGQRVPASTGRSSTSASEIGIDDMSADDLVRRGRRRRPSHARRLHPGPRRRPHRRRRRHLLPRRRRRASPAWAPTRATTRSAPRTPDGRPADRNATSSSTRSSPTGTTHEATAVSDVVFLLHGQGGLGDPARRPLPRHAPPATDGTWRFHRRVAEFVERRLECQARSAGEVGHEVACELLDLGCARFGPAAHEVAVAGVAPLAGVLGRAVSRSSSDSDPARRMSDGSRPASAASWSMRSDASRSEFGVPKACHTSAYFATSGSVRLGPVPPIQMGGWGCCTGVGRSCASCSDTAWPS